MSITSFFETLSVHWWVYALMSMFFLGCAMSVFKIPSINKDVTNNGLNVWFSIFLMVLATIFFYPTNGIFNPDTKLIIVAIAFTQGILLTLRTLLQTKALSMFRANDLFPTTSVSGLVIIIFIGILFFHDHLSLTRDLGIILAVITIYLFARKGNPITLEKKAIIFWIGIVTLSVAGNLSNKFAADIGDLHTFLFYSYIATLVSSLFMLSLTKLSGGEIKKQVIHIGALSYGIISAILAFFGSWSLLQALTLGPVSAVQTINSSYVFVTSIVVWFIFDEKLTTRKMFLIFLAVLAMILIRVG